MRLPSDFREWDRYSCQMSDPVFLQAGQAYYIEILHQDYLAPGHFSVAWSYTDQQTGLAADRELIPAAQLRSYVEDPDDADDDYLPDSWETSTGLNPLDNGHSDLAREGEYGDYDGDLLTNREEWLAGSDPTKADTDGDGISDYDEVKSYHSDPAVANASPEQLVGSVSPLAVTGLGQDWVDTGSGVMATSFRDDGTWNFSVPSAGFWLLRVDLKLIGDLDALETLPVRMKIDGVDIGSRGRHLPRQRTRLHPGLHLLPHPGKPCAQSVLRQLHGAPFRRGDRHFRAHACGPDSNGNGYSDLIESLLREAARSRITPSWRSHVSPFFIEGRTRSLDLFELRAAHEGPGSTIRHKDSYWDKTIPRIQLARDSTVVGITAAPGKRPLGSR